THRIAHALWMAGRPEIASWLANLVSLVFGPDPFGGSAIHSWMAVSAVAFIMLRSMAMVLMAAERSRNQLTELAHHDPLTGALNRGGLA
ncbi:hypothetical protein AB9F41_34955, partial [Rhizobium leguminosarum]